MAGLRANALSMSMGLGVWEGMGVNTQPLRGSINNLLCAWLPDPAVPFQLTRALFRSLFLSLLPPDACTDAFS